MLYSSILHRAITILAILVAYTPFTIVTIKHAQPGGGQERLNHPTVGHHGHLYKPESQLESFNEQIRPTSQKSHQYPATNPKTIATSSHDDSSIIWDAYKPYSSPDGNSISFSSLDKLSKIKLKRQILDALGIEDIPTNITNANNSGALYIHSLYDKISAGVRGRFVVDPNDAFIQVTIPNGEDGHVKITERLSIETQEAINKSDTIVSCTNQEQTFDAKSLTYDISPSISKILDLNTPILGAHLRIFRNASNSEYDREFFVFSESTITGPISADHHGWITLNVTQQIIHWARSNAQIRSNKVTFELGYLNEESKVLNTKVGFLTSASVPRELQPFLVIFLLTKDVHNRLAGNVQEEPGMQITRSPKEFKQENNDNRHRRSLETTANNSTTGFKPNEKSQRNNTKVPVRNPYHQKFCNKHSFFVSFTDLKWSDWIIAPDGYEAWYCEGKCPFPLHPNLNSSNHAIVQMLAHLMNPQIPEPCCAPTKLQPISVLYYDDYSNVVLKKYRNMIVQSCGCL